MVNFTWATWFLDSVSNAIDDARPIRSPLSVHSHGSCVAIITL
ncbi:hypothetical protein [Pyxidicoccus caerfyrddinensis]|nr:hypothetical protein [Pyxidicoccus caerfyrddinensis]